MSVGGCYYEFIKMVGYLDIRVYFGFISWINGEVNMILLKWWRIWVLVFVFGLVVDGVRLI